MIKSIRFIFIFLTLSCITSNTLAENNFAMPVFKEYCWGCHHQTAQAFGPSFKEIANHRKKEEIIAQIIAPQNTYKLLGYKRNSMPAFNDLSTTQLNLIVDYILSFKNKK